MEKHPLRDYQQAAVDTAISWCKYKDTPCIIDMATGAGKSHVIAALAEHFYKESKRVCILAHRKELLEQTGEKMTIEFGYNSASVGDKDTDSQVIIGGIQSIYNKQFDKFDVIICDEAHRMPNNKELGQYWQFIDKHQPCKLIGLTATPFRLDGGKLGWGEIIYEAKYPLLLDQGHLAPLTNKVKKAPDLSKVKIIAGEYSEAALSHVMEDPELIGAAIRNIIAYGKDRESILIFCVTVSHADVLMKAMKANGLPSAMISGDTARGDREQIIEDFRSGKLKYLLNCQTLIEGFDAPNIDMIIDLSPTKSKSRHEQKLGRGSRKHLEKENCLIIDMAGNLMEHGGLGTPFFDRTRKESKKTIGRICPECETLCKRNTRECPDCGFQFPEPEKKKASHSSEADTGNDTVFQPISVYDVEGVMYREHVSKQGKISLRVDYACNTRYGAISEWLSPHNPSEFARSKAHLFFKERGWDAYGGIDKYSMEDLLFHAERLKKPVRIHVDHNEKFPRIVKYEWENPVSLGELLDDEIPFV